MQCLCHTGADSQEDKRGSQKYCGGGRETAGRGRHTPNQTPSELERRRRSTREKEEEKKEDVERRLSEAYFVDADGGGVTVVEAEVHAGGWSPVREGFDC